MIMGIATPDTSRSRSCSCDRQRTSMRSEKPLTSAIKSLKLRVSRHPKETSSRRGRRHKSHKMAVLSSLSPIPSLPSYTGSYTVGTHDVEVPNTELSSAASTNAPDPSINTTAFRLFYPCAQPERARPSRHPYWLPEPQNQYWRAYALFLQASPWLASLLSYVPILRFINHTFIPAYQDAEPLSPPNDLGRWPVMVFSHGLGGSRNAYSQLCGSLASHGMVVLAADHRDGSAPIVFLKDSSTSELRPVHYTTLPHHESAEVEEGRIAQLKIRLWEMGLAYEALLHIDGGRPLVNTINTNSSSILSRLASHLDVHEPGKIAWAGHSFGAATVYQFVKSVYHSGLSSLYAIPSSSSLTQQITPASPVILLDLWTLPLTFSSLQELWKRPLPAYTKTSDTERVSNRSAPLTILSEGFYKWTSNFQATLRAVSPPSSSSSEVPRPHIFYPVTSAHLSQSDFGLLFPWLTRKVLRAEEPERTMRLNVRAILESLRRSGIRVSDTNALDMEIETDSKPADNEKILHKSGQDHSILSTDDGSVRGWIAIDVDKESHESPTSSPSTRKAMQAERVEESMTSPDGAVMQHEGSTVMA